MDLVFVQFGIVQLILACHEGEPEILAHTVSNGGRCPETTYRGKVVIERSDEITFHVSEGERKRKKQI